MGNINPTWTPPDKPPVPIFPKGFFNAKNITFEYIVMVVLSQVGMQSIEYQLYQLAQKQPDADAVRDDLYQIMNLISEIENGAKSGNGLPTGKAEELAKQLAGLVKKLYGPNGDLAKLEAQIGPNNPAVTMAEGLKNDLNEAFSSNQSWGKDNKDGISWHNISDVVGKIISGDVNMGDLAADLQKFAANFYYSSHSTETPKNWVGGNELNTWYASSQSGQQALQGLSSEFTADVQELSSNLTSEQKTGQQMLQIANQLKQAEVQDQKSQ